MSATAQFAFMAALHTLWDAGLDVPVHDGPKIVDKSSYTGVWVGHDPFAEDGKVVDTEQDWAQMGNRRKDETGTVTCSIASWSGDTDTIKRTQRVTELLSECEALVRADITLAGVVQFCNVVQTSSLYRQLTDQGNEVVCVFAVSYKARI